eukprot:TRINITY_DN1657_c0_g1_i1.p1 TRINITY_DN1657_c0_g1~~TRINITY_DN1657_c0_g1_i1.p1  ORF type:complete len:697 (-),score=62.29 TRINITY_DN1657_c0_g1_i1:1724-3814(-)
MPATPGTRLHRIARNLLRISRKSVLHSRFKTPRLLSLFVAALIVVLIVLRGSLPKPATQAALLPLTFDLPHSLSSFSLSILLLIPSFTDLKPPFSPTAAANPADVYNYSSLTLLIDSLIQAEYGNDPVPLTLYLSPHRHANHFQLLYQNLSKIQWPHGRLEIRNASSGGFFDWVMSALNPSRDNNDLILIIDASAETPLSAAYYSYLKSTAKQHSEAQIAGYALSPVEVKRKGGADNYAPASDTAPVFFYQSAPLVPSLAVRADVWRSFRTWFYAHRSEWFLWPTVVAPRDKKDPAWNRYDGTARAHWSLWFSRFCVDFELFNVYPTRKPTKMLSANPEQQATRIEAFNFDGTQATVKSSISAEKLAKIVELGKQMGGSVSMTLVNDAFLETARSWICNVDVAQIRPPGVVWFTVDDTAYNALKNVNGSYAIRMEEFRGGRKREGTSYGTPGYWLLMLERTKLIQSILDSGIGVFAFETDQIWLRDPVPFVNRLVHSGDEVDIVGTLDTRHEIGGNFLFLNPTLAMRRTWREVCRRFEKSYKSSRLHGHSAKYKRYVENDQSILTKLVFYDEDFKIKNPTIFRALDTELFVDGRWYDKEKHYYTSAKSKSPILINNNFLIGIENKKQRAIKNNHWFLTENKCNVKRVKEAIILNEERGGVSLPVDGDVLATTVEGSDVEAGLDAALSAIEIERANS